MEPKQKLSSFILTQHQRGVDPNEIAQQLRTAGWKEEDITAGFELASQSMRTAASPPAESPSTTQTEPSEKEPQEKSDLIETNTQASPDTPGEPIQQLQPITHPKRGRIKTGWLLLKQSAGLLNKNRSLLRYPLISLAVSLVVLALFIGLYILDFFTIHLLSEEAVSEFGAEEFGLTPLGYVVGFIYYVTAFFITFYYAAGLSAHVLDLFRGQTSSYSHYMGLARSKAGPILAYSAITATVGILLQFIAERFKFLGWIISKVLGVVWSLATVFVVPIIVETDKSAVGSIKSSIGLFKKTWGETITGRVTLGGIMFLIYLLVFIPIFILLSFGLGAVIGDWGVLVAFIVFFVSVILFGIIEVAATNILNTALYFYAQYGQIPANFDPDLLRSVFQEKKKRKGLFRH